MVAVCGSLVAALIAGCLYNAALCQDSEDFVTGILALQENIPNTPNGRRMLKCYDHLPQLESLLSSFDGVCETFDIMRKYWEEGCDTVFLEVKRVVEIQFQGAVCFAASLCRKRGEPLDPMQAECLDRCSNEIQMVDAAVDATVDATNNTGVDATNNATNNTGVIATNNTGADATNNTGVDATINTVEKVQKTVPSCEESFFLQVGLNHPKICGGSLPLEYTYGMLNLPFDIFLNFFVTVITMPVQYISVAMFQPHKFIPFGMALNVFVQFFCLFACTYRLNKAMWGEHVTHTCRFFVFSTLYMYGPCATAFNSIMSTLGVRLAWMAGEGVSEETLCNKWWIPYYLFVLPTLFLGCFSLGLGFLFLICGLLPLFVIAFWGIFAYIHIAFILLLPVFLLMCCAIPFVEVLQKVAKEAREKAARKQGREVREDDGRENLLAWTFFTVVMVYLAQILVGFLGATAMLYWHGEYLRFHSPFFNQWSAPTVTFPSINMIFVFDWNIFKWLWKQMVSLELALPLQLVYGASIMSQVVCAIIVAASGIVRGLRGARQKEGTSAPETSA